MNRTNVHSSRRAVIARHLVALGAALTLGITGIAAAQPAGAPHAGGHGGGEGMLAQMLQSAKARLNLNTSQQLAWDNTVAQSKAARQQAMASRQRVHDALQAELAKPEPDLDAVANVGDQVQQQNHVAHIAVRNQWLALYATLSPDQKAIVRDGMAQRLARMDSFRGRMHDHFRGPARSG